MLRRHPRIHTKYIINTYAHSDSHFSCCERFKWLYFRAVISPIVLFKKTFHKTLLFSRTVYNNLHYFFFISTCFYIQASPASKAFYAKAKMSMWQQATVLCGVGIVSLVTTTTKHLTVVGRSTPVILFTVQVRPHPSSSVAGLGSPGQWMSQGLSMCVHTLDKVGREISELTSTVPSTCVT